jgi:hypothetical protein
MPSDARRRSANPPTASFGRAARCAGARRMIFDLDFQTAEKSN